MPRFLILLFALFLTVRVQAGDDVKLISLYPVPLKTSTLFVKLNQTGSGINRIELRNLIGKKMQEKSVLSGTDEIYFDDLLAYPNGVYVVIAKNNDGKVLEISKFILNR